MPSETELLTAFAETRAEAAFRAIIEIHGGMVFATALRQVGDRGLAEEIAQDVFILLVKKASTLRHNATIGGWLYKTTLNQSRARLRSELRRRKREILSAEMRALSHEGESTWTSLSPLLDEAVAALPEPDQTAVVLRFMEDRPFHEVGRVLGIGEDAARKRIDRIVHTLSEFFRQRSLPVSTSALAVFMTVNIKAIPASPKLVANIIKAGLPIGAASAGAVIVSTIIMTSTQFKIASAILIALVLAGTVPALLKNKERAPHAAAVPATPTPLPNPPTQNSATAPLTISPTAPPVALLPAANFFTRLQQGDTSLTILPKAQADAFIQANHTNAESLLAAYQVTRDKDYLRRAAETFTNDPTVLIRAIGFEIAPENKRQMIDQLKTADPDNAIASYLSAADHFKNNEPQAAFKDLAEAAGRQNFRDYTIEQSQTMEEIYLAAGHTPAEAKALGISSLELPHLRQIVDVARGIQSLMDQYAQAGDTSSVSALAQSGLQLASRLESADQGGVMRLGEFLGWKMHQGFLNKLNPTQDYPFLNGNVAANLKLATDREQAMQADNGVVSAWLANASDSDIIAFYDRIKVYGESPALQWLRERFPAE
jgi:RNA polymerase sigma factor (sigma-70 family)